MTQSLTNQKPIYSECLSKSNILYEKGEQRFFDENILGDCHLKLLYSLRDLNYKTQSKTRDISSTIEEAFANLSKRISIVLSSDVHDYLINNQDIVGILPDICNKVVGVFGNDSSFWLELYKDPEINDEYLTLFISQNLYSHSQADEIIDGIYDQFRNDLADTAGWILITEDHRSNSS